MGKIEDHAIRFSHHSEIARLSQCGLTPARYKRLRDGFETCRVRESAIPEDDVESALQFFVQHPDVGSAKARLSLIDKEKAALSSVTLNQVKQELTRIVAEQYQRRKEEEKLLEAQLHKELLSRRGQENYEYFRAEYPNHVWSLDFSNIMLLGMPVVICEVYDEYSQHYLALRVGNFADHELATACFRDAVKRAAKTPEYVRRDNGKPFQTISFQKHLGDAKDYPIPPGSPWFNGSLESSHTSLKAAFKTTLMQDIAVNTKIYRGIRQDQEKLLEHLQSIIDRVRIMLNHDICRLKHNMSPARVYNGEEEVTRQRHQAFIERKRQERHQRMAAIRASTPEKRTHRTMLEKVVYSARKIINSMETNALYTLNEVLHRRYQLCET